MYKCEHSLTYSLPGPIFCYEKTFFWYLFYNILKSHSQKFLINHTKNTLNDKFTFESSWNAVSHKSVEKDHTWAQGKRKDSAKTLSKVMLMIYVTVPFLLIFTVMSSKEGSHPSHFHSSIRFQVLMLSYLNNLGALFSLSVLPTFVWDNL